MNPFNRDLPIIKSLTDIDFYKVTMGQAVVHQFPSTLVRYRFKCRSDFDLRPFAEEIRAEIDKLGDLKASTDELNHFSTIRYLKPSFISFFERLRLKPDLVNVIKGKESLEIDTKLAPWSDTIWFETMVLGIVSEVIYRNLYPRPDMDGAKALLREKIELIRLRRDPNKPYRLIEFGTRRRFSGNWQEYVTEELAREIPDELFGTSNIRLARLLGLKPIGTMAHEWLQGAQATQVRLAESQKFAFECWVKEYRGDLGIALTDIFGMKAFLADFDLYFAKLFDGGRQDSGDPYEWGYRFLDHYKRMSIDATTKNGVFSDSLTVASSLDLRDTFEGLFRASFGIGTSLTCDIPGIKPIPMVMKMVECNGQPVAKVSDSSGKGMCEDNTLLNWLGTIINQKEAEYERTHPGFVMPARPTAKKARKR